MTTKEKTEEKNTKEESEERKVIAPGEILAKDESILPGEGTRKEGKEIIATRFGLLEKSGKLLRIIPLSGVYIPRRGNVVIGRILDLTFNGWIIDINAPSQSFLPVAECAKYINKNDLAEYLDIGDVVAVKISSVKTKGIDLTEKGKGLGRLDSGMIIYINSSKVPRVIGKEGSMVKIIKDESNCRITVGQNGVVWIKGDKIEDELFAKEIINYISNKSFVRGLTEKVQLWIKEKKGEKK